MKIHNSWVNNLSIQQKYIISQLMPKDYAIAELQPFGLSIRNINFLKDQLNVIYLNDLLSLDPNYVCVVVSHLGRGFLIEIKRALERVNIKCDCGKMLKNNLYGNRCEDCYAVAHRTITRSVNKNLGPYENVADRRVIHPHVDE